MKKTTLLALVLAAIPAALRAQDCAALPVPYSLDFESAVIPLSPYCTFINPAPANYRNWQIVNSPGNGFTTKALTIPQNIEPTTETTFLTQLVQLTAGTYYKISYTYGSNITTANTQSLTSFLNVENYINIDAEMAIETHTNFTAATPVTYTSGLVTVAATGNYYIGIRGATTSNQGTIYLDNIEVTALDCQVPTDIIFTNITPVSATFSWTAPVNNTNLIYSYWYSTSPEPPTNNPPVVGNGTTVSIDNLTPGTTYYLFMRNQCGSISSIWTEAISFTTPAIAGVSNATFAGLTAYPNPVKNILTLNNNATIERAEVYNVTGQLVLQQDINNTAAQVNLEKLSAGAYFLNIYSGKDRKIIKLIKE
jgi:hypothetical protein